MRVALAAVAAFVALSPASAAVFIAPAQGQPIDFSSLLNQGIGSYAITINSSQQAASKFSSLLVYDVVDQKRYDLSGNLVDSAVYNATSLNVTYSLEEPLRRFGASHFPDIDTIADGLHYVLHVTDVVAIAQGDFIPGEEVTISTEYSPRTFAGIPEPAAWAMMVAGFGMVGGATRRRVSYRLA
jgi:hypothetical protein